MENMKYGNFCFTEFWNLNVTWYAEIPDFTPCFQNSVLVFVPCGCFWLATVLNVWRTKSTIKKFLPWTLLFILKVILCLGLLTVSFTELVLSVHGKISGEKIPDVIIYSSCTKLGTFVLVFFMLFQDKCRGNRTSTILSLFWLTLVICGIVTYRSTFLRAFIENFPPISEAQFILNVLYYPMVVSQFLLSLLKDAKSYEDANKVLNPLDEESFFSLLTFHWMTPMVIQGNKKPLTLNDFPPLNSQLKANNLFGKFKTQWMTSINLSDRTDNGIGEIASDKVVINQPSSPSLAWTVIKSFLPWILLASILELIFDVVRFFPTLILDLAISFTESNDPLWKGYLFCFAMFFSTLLIAFVLNQAIYYAILSAMQIKSALTSATYRKSLHLSSSAKQQYTTGELVNLMAVDADKIYNFAMFAPLTFGSPIKIAITIALLWQYIGPSCLAGVAVIALLIPITGVISRKNHTVQEKQMKTKDLRLKHMSEILSGIKVLKLYAWEVPFIEKLQNIRNKEVNLIKIFQFCYAGFTFIWCCAPFLIALASFVTYVLVDENNILDPTKAFVSLTLFNSLKFSLIMIPDMISNIIQTNISLRRLRKFLACEELDKDAVGNTPDKGEAISVREATLSWRKSEAPILKCINFHVLKGKLVAVVGQVGSGKSSLLNAILGDMVKLSGTIDMKGKIAYVPQQAWVQNNTLKQNILFVQQMNENFYNKVLDNCCLKPDLEMLPGGDMTEIGEKGVNLSGGQKQRISLARAVYQDSDVYLLDDPLSAVDAHVGKYLFDNVIGPKGMLRRKTRVLVTNNISILPDVDNIVTMKDGKIEEAGTYDELMSRKGQFFSFIVEHLKRQEDSEDESKEAESKSALHHRHRTITNESESSDYIRSLSQIEIATSRQSSHSLIRTPSVEVVPKLFGALLIEEEKMEIGKVKGSIYLNYLRHASFYNVFGVFFWYIVYQSLEIGANVWLSEWSTDPLLPDGTQNIPLRNLRMGIYAVLGLGQGVGIVLAAITLALAAARASALLHHEMLHCIMRLPMSFFDTTPLGRILNRFGKDIDVVDTQLPADMDGWLSCLVVALGTFIIVGINVPIFIALLIPIGLLCYLIQRAFLFSSRQIKRLESTTRSPVYSHFSETIQGVTSIRAYNVEDEFVKRADCKIDTNIGCYFYGVSVNRWLSFRLDLIGSVIVLAASLLAVLNRGVLDAGTVGLILSYSLSVTDALTWLVRMNGELETKIVAVERIDEYSKLTSEAPWEADDCSPPSTWPVNGVVSFKDYSTRYREGLDLVLKKINLDIFSNEKVGIVGRTGAGKSSLTLALFRIIEPTGGTILIDNINISNIGLHDLRPKLTIIPQDPVLFTGTLRINLDPNECYTDEDLWTSLEHAHLKNYISSLDGGLMYEVSEGGENLSVGQRQLICLARALLKKTKVLVLDEATAAVDMETDRLIQNTIRTEFGDCTIVTIAHRIHTIMDYDKVVVMDDGKVAEVGVPTELLQNPCSMFYSLAKDAGLA